VGAGDGGQRLLRARQELDRAAGVAADVGDARLDERAQRPRQEVPVGAEAPARAPSLAAKASAARARTLRAATAMVSIRRSRDRASAGQVASTWAKAPAPRLRSA
jgi:hypothetical protein